MGAPADHVLSFVITHQAPFALLVSASDRPWAVPCPQGTVNVQMLNKCLNFSSLCCVATLMDTLHHLQANTKPFGIQFFMNSPQVAIVTP